MFKILGVTLALTGAAPAFAQSYHPCEHALDLAQPAAEDVYHRLGFDGPVSLIEVTIRYRELMRYYRDQPEVKRRFGDAYDDIKLEGAPNARFDNFELPYVAAFRAHGHIRGPQGGRFTDGYGLDDFMRPTMDANVVVSGMLNAEPTRSKLLAMDPAWRETFKSFVHYFIQNIRRVGIEGGFEDVIAASNEWLRGAKSRERPALMGVRPLFVEIFGAMYMAAVTEPRGPGITDVRRMLGRVKLPPPPSPVAIEQRLAEELDPRTFLRHTIYHFRKSGGRSALGPALASFAWLYEHRFFADETRFVQHLLFFGADQWTDRMLNVHDAADHRLIDALIQRLEHRWIIEPQRLGLPERWHDFVSVLWDANRMITKQAYARHPDQPDSPMWRRLSEIQDRTPEMIERLEAERGPRGLPSDVLPW